MTAAAAVDDDNHDKEEEKTTIIKNGREREGDRKEKMRSYRNNLIFVRSCVAISV